MRIIFSNHDDLESAFHGDGGAQAMHKAPRRQTDPRNRTAGRAEFRAEPTRPARERGRELTCKNLALRYESFLLGAVRAGLPPHRSANTPLFTSG